MTVIGEIRPAVHRDPVTLLREIADSIESGDVGDVTSIAVVHFGDTGLEMYGGGVDSTPPTIGLILLAAANKMAGALIEA